MNVENGEILSLVSLPDFDINLRSDLREKKYINKITKGVYELGSILKLSRSHLQSIMIL